MNHAEHVFTFSCEGKTLIGITTIPEQPQNVGMLVVVGGPQYRVGSHRQFVLLSRDLASQGVVCMRFDGVGMGDSAGALRNFENVSSDIRAAVDAFFVQVPALTRIVLWGLCDGASAACLYAPQDERVGSLVLLNPWVRTEQGQATAYLKHYYGNRLFERAFWIKVFRGEFNVMRSLTSLARNLVHDLAGRLRAARVDPAGEPSFESLEFPERMAAALGRFNAPVLIVLSENDLTAAEFSDYSKTSRRWQVILKRSDVVIARIPEADHTFSSAAWRARVSQLTYSWMTGRELRRIAATFLLLLISLVSLWPATPAASTSPQARLLRVGPAQSLTRIADAARVAKDGDTIEIDAGVYAADVAVWDKSNLTIRGVGGAVRVAAGGASAEGKASWIVRGDQIVIENITFTGSRVADGNGAGIRHERGKLKVSNCIFKDNQNGILTGNDASSELEIERSEFGSNGAGDGHTHNLYVGAIRKLTVTGSYFHHANVGHLLKSRASQNYVMYNRLTDESGGTASYELEFPAGGLAYVVGNIIQQGPETENSSVISFGAEGYRWPRNELYLVNNTIANDRPEGGTFLRVAPGAQRVKAVNNLLLGKGNLEAGPAVEYAANFHAERNDTASASNQDYRLKRASKLVGKAVDPGVANGLTLRPDSEYVHARQIRTVQPGRPLSPGALQSEAP